MISLVEIKEGNKLEDYEKYANLVMPVKELLQEAEILVPNIKKHKIWMINSTAQGGGVAEMLPRMLSIMRQLELNIEWAVIGTEEQPFFQFTKKMHNLIHGQGEPHISEEEKIVFEAVNKENADDFAKNHLGEDDIVIIHDPQPMAMIQYLKSKFPKVKFIWRCHIGLDSDTPETDAVWAFLKPYLLQYDHSIFTAPEYIPKYLSSSVSIIHPSLAPLSHKNRELRLNKFTGILYSADLLPQRHNVINPAFENTVKRVQADGGVDSPWKPNDFEFLYSPLILQVSRWDRLKGFIGLMKGFTHLKQNIDKYQKSEQHKRTLSIARLALAGPDPAFIQDDPEGVEVIKELIEFYTNLSSEVQKDIAILQLPMQSAKENALIVNALQRCSTVVVQNSLQEGFGLTVTEAMWKNITVVAAAACGIRQQIRDGIDGRLIQDANDAEEIAQVLADVFESDKQAEVYAQNAQKRVYNEFLVFTQIRKYMNLINQVR